jgi:hypothetical protein
LFTHLFEQQTPAVEQGDMSGNPHLLFNTGALPEQQNPVVHVPLPVQASPISRASHMPLTLHS